MKQIVNGESVEMTAEEYAEWKAWVDSFPPLPDLADEKDFVDALETMGVQL